MPHDDSKRVGVVGSAGQHVVPRQVEHNPSQEMQLQALNLSSWSSDSWAVVAADLTRFAAGSRRAAAPLTSLMRLRRRDVLALPTSLAQLRIALSFSGQWPPFAAPSGVGARRVSGHAQHDTGARRGAWRAAWHGIPQRRRALEARV